MTRVNEGIQSKATIIRGVQGARIAANSERGQIASFDFNDQIIKV